MDKFLVKCNRGSKEREACRSVTSDNVCEVSREIDDSHPDRGRGNLVNQNNNIVKIPSVQRAKSKYKVCVC